MQLVGVSEREKRETIIKELFKDIIEENIPEMKKIILKVFREKGLTHCSTVCIVMFLSGVLYKSQLGLNG